VSDRETERGRERQRERERERKKERERKREKDNNNRPSTSQQVQQTNGCHAGDGNRAWVFFWQNVSYVCFFPHKNIHIF
jgi:hypothetical protein